MVVVGRSAKSANIGEFEIQDLHSGGDTGTLVESNIVREIYFQD